jgi:hypothetical protein
LIWFVSSYFLYSILGICICFSQFWVLWAYKTHLLSVVCLACYTSNQMTCFYKYCCFNCYFLLNVCSVTLSIMNMTFPISCI